MGSAEGAERAAAARIGVSVDEYRAKRARGLKWCHACAEWRPTGDFARDRSRGDGLKARCSSHDARADAPPRPERDRMASLGLAWCRDCRWWLSADDISDGLCKAHRRQRERDWYRAGGWRYRIGRAAQRRRGLDAVPTWYREEMLEGGCAYCPAPATTVDHVIPVAHGGRTEPGNVVPACASCNSRKRDSEPLLWLERMDQEWVERLSAQPMVGVGAAEVIFGEV